MQIWGAASDFGLDYTEMRTAFGSGLWANQSHTRIGHQGGPNDEGGNKNYAAFTGVESLKGSRWDDIQNTVFTNSFIV